MTVRLPVRRRVPAPLLILIAVASLAPIRNPTYDTGNWGGNAGGGGNGACALTIGDEEGTWCSGGYDSEDFDLDWFTECDEDRCHAAATCPDGTEISCEGEFEAQAGEGAVYCFDNGSTFPIDNDWC